MTLKNLWHTERLVVSDLIPEEIDTTQRLYETSSNILDWDGRESDPDYVHKCYYQGDLPPNGLIEQYKIQSIKRKLDMEPVGLLSIYHGYPNDHIVYLSFMCIGNHFKRQGYGQEIILQLTEKLRESSFKEIRINVALKNWSALRFWINVGFDKINGLFGDHEYSLDANGSIELSKFL